MHTPTDERERSAAERSHKAERLAGQLANERPSPCVNRIARTSFCFVTRRAFAPTASMRSTLRYVFFWLWALAIGFCWPPFSNATVITYAGIAYAGDAANIETRFKYSKRYEKALVAQNTDINAKLRRTLADAHYPFDLNMLGNTEVKGDKTLVTALTVTGETISDETFGAVHKLYIQIRAQAMIFDFESHMLERAYPLEFAYLDALDHTPTDTEIDERIIKVYEGSQGKQGIFGRYAKALSNATLPSKDGLFVQITNVAIGPDAKPAIPAVLSVYPGAAESWLANSFDEALNSRTGVPVLPYSVGYAIGNVMAIQLANTNFDLKFPPPDWDIAIDVTGVKKVTYAQNPIGTSYVYGAYATIRISLHDGTKVVLDAKFKNGEVKTVPATQSYIDDLPAYGDSIRGLFDKLADVLGGQDTQWLKTAAVTPNIQPQIVAARALLQKCK
jgi:hypothetical protein